MLKNTFIHIPGIGLKTEELLWDSGILNWDDCSEPFPLKLPQNRITHLRTYIHDSRENLEIDNPKYFEKLLPSSLHWRMFPEFRHFTVYLDIETTGLSPWYSEVTVVGIHLCNGLDTNFIQIVGEDITAESILEGAECLASKGIVPVASVWLPFGRPVIVNLI